MLHNSDMNTKRILCLDLGSKTGWAVSIQESGVFEMTHNRFEGGGMRYVRFRKFLEWILSTGIDEVYFEEVRAHKGTDAAHMYGALSAMVCEMCENLKIPYLGVPVATIKRIATGSGNANKERMLEVAQKMGWEPKNDDHADALWLLHAVTLGRHLEVASKKPIERRKKNGHDEAVLPGTQ